jgi:hypothetical protein
MENNTSIQQLLESANPWKSLQNDAARLAKKWAVTGLLDKMDGEIQKNNMAMILENQAKQLVVESSTSGGGTAGASFTVGTGEQWAGIALPMVRKIFGQISSKEFVSVQPMNLPSGLIFFLDFQYGTTKNPFTAGDSLYGTTSGSGDSTGGLYGAGRFTYSTNNTQSIVATATVATASWADLNFDSNYSASAIAGGYKTITVPTASFMDLEGVKGFILTSGSVVNVGHNLPVFTVLNAASTQITFVMTGSIFAQLTSSANMTMSYQVQTTDNRRGDFEQGNNTINTNNTPISIPEINIQLRSEAIVAKTKKLKATWTPEFAQDLNAYQNLDAESELTGIMSEYVSLEIDLEIIDMLIENAPSTEYWSAVNNLAFNTTTGNGTFTNLGFYNSQGQWFQTLGTKIQKLSNIIHQKTLRGGANFLICSPTVSTVIESIPGFASNGDGDVTKAKYAFGVQKSGQLNGRYTIYKNPYMQENTILMGYKGSQFLETGAVFAPYVPLIMTPLVYNPDTYVPSKGLLTRFAKKMVRPEFYAKIYVNGLNTL